MRGVIVGRTAIALAAAAGLTLSGGLTAEAHGYSHGPGKSRALTCTGGEIGSGTYASITVTGACSVAKNAVVTVKGDITVRKGAALDAQSSPSTITVGGNVTALRGSTLGLGCQPTVLMGNSAHPCVDADGNPIEDVKVFSTIAVKGSVTALGASVVLINGTSVGRDVTIVGGGDPLIPWSVKNNTVKGNLWASNVNTTFFGAMFNKVGKNVVLLAIKITDTEPEGTKDVYVVQNKIGRNLVCTGLSGVSGGFVPGAVNTVGGKALGQCKELAG
ncbi:MAG: hypothetical protein QM582_03220 [Micropruina sp.]|uniref:hypothetical protein n=1 Tax=Micropruina sp. TaxID=2737536 RepID=UPI0039E259C6